MTRRPEREEGFESGATAGSEVRALILGPLPPPYSGTTVSFQELVRDLDSVAEVEVVSVLDTEADKSSGTVLKALRALRLANQTLHASGRSDVILLNASARRAMYFGAALSFIARARRRPLVVRAFGGGLNEEYRQGSCTLRWCTDRVFRTCKVLLQTHALKRTFGDVYPESDIVWFPTSRNHQRHRGDGQDQRVEDALVRFVFASEVRPLKGIDTLVEAFARVGGVRAELDVFGELFEPYISEGFGKTGAWPESVRYCGSVDSDTLRAALPSYDCLLLPTRCESEGYPGVIIEAFGAGLPVIVSRMGAIPEIVDESCGMILDPCDVGAWTGAITGFAGSPSLRAALSSGALAQARKFDSAIWNGRVMAQILRSAAKDRAAR